MHSRECLNPHLFPQIYTWIIFASLQLHLFKMKSTDYIFAHSYLFFEITDFEMLLFFLYNLEIRNIDRKLENWTVESLKHVLIKNACILILTCICLISALMPILKIELYSVVINSVLFFGCWVLLVLCFVLFFLWGRVFGYW